MTYQQALDFIHSRLKFGINPGLERVSALLERLGNPHNTLKYIHTSGTNGKGTVCTLVASALKEEGYKTGLFTSPYVTDFCERIKINGKNITKDILCSLTEKLIPHINELEKKGIILTEFEVITVLAFLYFSEECCDIVVLETGLGGRLDSTNIITCPAVSVITSISFDHTAILGDTIEKIAFEKSGIIKKNGITVAYPLMNSSALGVIKERCEKLESRLVLPDLSSLKNIQSGIFETNYTYYNINFKIKFAGKHQIYNALTAFEALRAISDNGFFISEGNIVSGFEKATLPARQEVLCKRPLIILDGAHNPEGTYALAESVKGINADKIIGLTAMMSDKDYKKAMENMSGLFDRIITTEIDNDRCLDCESLAQKSKKYCENVSHIKDCTEALSEALNRLEKDSALIIFGSLYLAGELRPILKQIQFASLRDSAGDWTHR